jgi:hypothetical protein
MDWQIATNFYSQQQAQQILSSPKRGQKHEVSRARASSQFSGGRILNESVSALPKKCGMPCAQN